jgi:hypothetical protein
MNPDARRLRPGSKGFDHVKDATGEAISNKTLNRLSVTYIRDPREIYRKVTRYADNTINYERRTKSGLDPEDIQSRTIHLAIGERCRNIGKLKRIVRRTETGAFDNFGNLGPGCQAKTRFAGNISPNQDIVDLRQQNRHPISPRDDSVSRLVNAEKFDGRHEAVRVAPLMFGETIIPRPGGAEPDRRH